ncbi:MAG: hypothetical protein AB1553_01780 [Nitrospirota bacterium]
MWQVRALVFVVLVLSIPTAFIWGWTIGVNDGVETGSRLAYAEMNNLLREGAAGHTHFMIQGLDAKFVPRPRKTMDFQIAGAGADTPVITAQARAAR